MLKVFTDGSCNNTGTKDSSMGLGIVVYYDGVLVDSVAMFGGFGTSNIAEWLAFTEASKIVKKRAKHFNCKDADFHLDSQLIVNQFNRKVKNNKFNKYADAIRNNLEGLNFEVSWIPREENKVADKLSKTGNINLTKDEFKI